MTRYVGWTITNLLFLAWMEMWGITTARAYGDLDADTSGARVAPESSQSYLMRREIERERLKGWYEAGDVLSPARRIQLFHDVQQMPNESSVGTRPLSATIPWVQKGPIGMQVYPSSPTRYYSGRVSALQYHSNGELFVGAASGGLWEVISPEFPVSAPISDNLPTLAVGGFAVHPTNSDTIFLGTGEYNWGWYGAGIYRTTNGGLDWVLLPTDPIPNKVSKVLVAPWDASIVFVSTNVGIFRLTSNGDTVTRVTTWNASAIASAPTGSYMLAGRNRVGVYKSTDFGITWEAILPTLPTSNVGRISLAIAPSQPSRAYVQIADSTTGQALGVYRSQNADNPFIFFQDITPTGALAGYLGQGWYQNSIAVHPTNEQIVWLGGNQLLRSTNGGGSWTDVGEGWVHEDIHAFSYRQPENILYVGSDGGVFATDDDGETWTYIVNPALPTTQFYNIDVCRTDDRVKYGSSQDNGTEGTSIAAPDFWLKTRGEDGIDVAVDWSNPSTIYATNNWGTRARTTNGGEDWDNNIDSGIVELVDWNVNQSYIIQDPVNPNRLYTNAPVHLYYTTNSGDFWQPINSTPLLGNVLHLAVNSSGYFVYAPTNMTAQLLMGYSRIGSSWVDTNLTSGLSTDDAIRVVVTSPTSPSRAYVVLIGADNAQKVLRTNTYGTSWEDVTGNLPEVLIVHDILEDPNNSDVLYLASEMGVFKTLNGGGSWYNWSSGMPQATMVRDLEYAYSASGDYLIAGTYGRSTFERPVGDTEGVLLFGTKVVDFGAITTGDAVTQPAVVWNIGNSIFSIVNVRTKSTYVTVVPNDASIQKGDSAVFSITLNPGLPTGKFASEIEFVHDGEKSPWVMGVVAYIGDATEYRSFSPESLLVKNPNKRKTASTSWCFEFPNASLHRDPATLLHVEFKNAALQFDSHAPFARAENKDRRGKIWEFSEGGVAYGSSAHICGQTSKSKPQEVKRWWWATEGGMLGLIQGSKLPTSQSPGPAMPNAANFRKEIFEQVPFNKDRPLMVGVADPNARSKKIAYVTFAKDADLLGSLMPGRSGKHHDGPPRCFDFFDNHKEMIGRIRKLTPDMQSNSLFAELVAFKLNIVGSALNKTPIGFGELKFNRVGHPLHGKLLKEIDSLANIYMTYCDSISIGSAQQLYLALHQINRAFEGPLDTVTFVTKLAFTGVRPIAEVPYLVRDPAIVPSRITPAAMATSAEPDNFEVHQNYPNPFNPTTTIEFSLPARSLVTLTVYDMLGQQVATLLDRAEMEDGAQEISFDASRLASGVYFYRIVADEFVGDEEALGSRSYVSMKKMILLK